MQSSKALLIICCFMLSYTASEAQFGKLLKEKAKKVSFDKIKSMANDAVDDERSKLDSTSFSYAISINDNADFYDADSKKDQAVKWVSNLKNQKDADEADKARRLLDVGELLYAKGHYKKADYTLRSAMLKYEQNNLTNDPNYYKVIADIGLLLSTMGRYTQAEEFTRDAMEKRKVAFSDTHSSYGASLNNLSVLQKETGRYNEAEQSIKKTVSILQNSFGKQSMPVAIALNNEAMLYQAMGRYDEAQGTLGEAITISEKIQSEKSNNHQKFLTNQALLYQEMGRYTESEAIFKEIIRLKQRFFGSNHPDYAHMLSNLASLYVEMGKFDEVEELLQEAIKIYRDNFDDDHRHIATATGYLGNFYRYQGRYDEAKPLLTKAVTINGQALGENHPDYAQSKEDLAILYWKMGEYGEAESLYNEALAKSLSFINSYFPPMSEAEKTKYWDKLRPRFERFYSFAIEASATNPELVGDMYDTHIGTKGLLLNATSKIKKKILASGDQGLIDQYLQWLDQKEMLARYYSYSKEELDDQEVNLDSLETAANSTEKQLSRQSKLFEEGYKLKQTTFQEVAAKLKADEAAVEVIRFRKFDNNLTDEANYAILTLAAGDKLPRHTVIENGGQLEQRYYKYYNNAIHQKIQDDYSYDQYWASIATLVNGKKKILLSLDGIYNQINLNTLRNASGSYVIDQYDLILIGNTKELVEETQHISSAKSAYLIGNPDFGGNAVASLPGTKTEIANVNKMLASKGYKANAKTGSGASEESIKSVVNPKLLHIATHGYFLKDNQLSKGKVFGISAESAKDNPLLRSGLLFSGASNVLEAENTASLESSNNGILTAYEAMNLTLDQTDLVVLSACETGVGDVKAGEGVYGLQRAFLAAGANAMIMSLWKVDDAATQELMTNFYNSWLRGNSKKFAFKQAQLALKKKYTSPYYWGAFILIGE